MKDSESGRPDFFYDTIPRTNRRMNNNNETYDSKSASVEPQRVSTRDIAPQFGGEDIDLKELLYFEYPCCQLVCSSAANHRIIH